MNAPRLLFIDIETSPSQVWTWDYWNTSISADKVIIPSEMICWAALWYGQDDVIFRSIHHDGRDIMVREAHRLMNEADWICTFNGNRFDLPRLNHAFLLAGLPPPSPSKSIDLYRAVKKFSFGHNSLENVLTTLGMPTKREHDGFSLWTRCMAGDAEAWNIMKDYCMQDTRVMVPLYERLRPWVPSIPSYAAVTGKRVCPACGSGRLRRKGFALTTTGKYQRLQCRNCGKWSRDTTRITGATVTSIAA